MTLQEENQGLRDKIEELQKFVENILQGPYIEGTVIALHKKLCRVESDGKDVILPLNPEIDIEVGDKVLCSQTAIIEALAKELRKPNKEVKFNLIGWDAIAGLSSQIERIKEAINAPTMYGSAYRAFGLSPCKGILLYGPPGCGKTLVAKAVASSFLKGKNISRDSFIYMKGGEMLSPYVGVAENNIKAAFERARNTEGSVIFIDEAEAILPARGSRHSSDVDSTIVPTFLSEMDGFEEGKTFVILATNYPNQLDEAIIRPGRIDLKIEISRPQKEDAEDIFRLYLKKSKCSDISSIAKKAAEALFNSPKARRVSGALIKSLVDNAALKAIKCGDSKITIKHVLNAITED